MTTRLRDCGMAKIMGQRPGSYQPGPTAQYLEIVSQRNHIISHLRPLCLRAKRLARTHAHLASAKPGDLPAFDQSDDSLHAKRKEAQHKQTGENGAITDQERTSFQRVA